MKPAVLAFFLAPSMQQADGRVLGGEGGEKERKKRLKFRCEDDPVSPPPLEKKRGNEKSFSNFFLFFSSSPKPSSYLRWGKRLSRAG